MLSGVGHAGWFDSITHDLVQTLIVLPIKEFIIGIFDSAMVGLQKWVFKPTDLMEGVMVEQTLEALKYIAMGLLAVNVMVEIIKSMYEEGYGEGGVPLESILVRSIKAFALIHLSPWILTDIILKANNLLLEVIGSIGSSEMMTTISDKFMQEEVTLSGGFILMAVVFLLYGLGLIILAVMAAFRHVQLIFLLSLSPLLAVSASGKGQAYNTWVREAIAVSFTQSFQCWALWLMSSQLLMSIDSSMFSTDRFWNVLTAIAFLVGTITGPSFLKKWLHSSGMGGAAGGAAKMAAYKIMTKTAIGK